jgi:hypothetical protein
MPLKIVPARAVVKVESNEKKSTREAIIVLDNCPGSVIIYLMKTTAEKKLAAKRINGSLKVLAAALKCASPAERPAIEAQIAKVEAMAAGGGVR